MKKILCVPGYWNLILHDKNRITSLFTCLFIKTSKIILTFNKGYISIFYIENHIFNKIYYEFGHNPKYLSFNRVK